MSNLGFHSISKWVKHLRAHDILCVLIGVTKSNMPRLGTYYDFISRFWGVSLETAKSGLLRYTKTPDISGDGTCIETGGNSLGIKTCDYIKKGIYNCIRQK